MVCVFLSTKWRGSTQHSSDPAFWDKGIEIIVLKEMQGRSTQATRGFTVISFHGHFVFINKYNGLRHFPGILLATSWFSFYFHSLTTRHLQPPHRKSKTKSWTLVLLKRWFIYFKLKSFNQCSQVKTVYAQSSVKMLWVRDRRWNYTVIIMSYWSPQKSKNKFHLRPYW